MKLSERQRQLPPMVAQLILYAYRCGYEITLGDAYRDPRVFGDSGVQKGYGHRYSNHKLRLAIDLNLWKDGQYITDEEDHARLHEFWVSIGGAPMIPGDGNHYSLDWEGRR